MTPKIPAQHALRRFFAGAIEDVFYAQLGICSPELVQYLTDLLTDFIHVREIYALQGTGGDTLKTVSEMIDRASTANDLPPQQRELLIHRHVGDYTLYWTGLFPEGLGLCKGPADYFVDYCEQGKESYAIASELSSENDRPPSALLRRLSQHYEDCVHGLTLTRRAWEAGS